MEENMKLYNEPSIEILIYSTADVIQSSAINTLDGNDPYMEEPEGWLRNDI